MSDVLKISEAASIGLHALALLACARGERLSGRVLSEQLGVSEAHLSKVMQRLSKAGYLASSRGPGGGFTLARPPADITLLEIFETIEGPLAETRCLLDHKACSGRCLLGNLIGQVQEQVRAHFSGKTLADVKGSFKAL